MQTSPFTFEEEVAAALVRTDRPTAVRIDTQNKYWERVCAQ